MTDAYSSNKWAKTNEHYVNLIKAAGWRVFVRPGNPYSRQYCYYTDGDVIGYAQWSSGRPQVGSIHMPNHQAGMGFQVRDEITPETLKEAAQCTCPNWARADRDYVTKYKDWDAFHNKDAFSKELVEV